MFRIETEQLTLRLLNKSDAPFILELLNEPMFINNIGDKGVRDIEGALDYINQGPLSMHAKLGYCLYACQLKSNGKLIGLSGLIKRDGIHHPEVGFAFIEEYCSQGFGYQSSKAVIEYARAQLDLNTLQAICNPDNKASIGLLTKLGFGYKGEVNLLLNNQKVCLYEQAFV